MLFLHSKRKNIKHSMLVCSSKFSIYVPVFALLWPFSIDITTSQTTVGQLCTLCAVPVHYWSDNFLVITSSKYENKLSQNQDIFGNLAEDVTNSTPFKRFGVSLISFYVFERNLLCSPRLDIIFIYFCDGKAECFEANSSIQGHMILQKSF